MTQSALGLLQEILWHPANQGSQVKALIRAIQWQCFKRISGRPWDVSYHGTLLRCYPNSHSASRAIYFSCLPDYWEMRFILDYLRPGDAFIDVGANVGLYTLLALSVVGEQGCVHAFEPNTETATRLRESLELNGASNVFLHEIGLSDRTGSAGFSKGEEDCTAHIVAADSSGDQIKVDRLDRVLEEIPFAMIKLDIEGHEIFAIRGASEWIKNSNPPVMLVEMAGYSKRYGMETSAIIEELSSLRYFTAFYDPVAKQLKRVTRPWEVPIDNVLAIAEDHVDFVESRVGSSLHDAAQADLRQFPGQPAEQCWS